MKRSLLVLFAVLAFVLGSTGCSSIARRYGSLPRNTVALSITVNGSDQPNPAQWAALIAMLEPTLASRGWVLVHDLSAANQILRVNFIPDPAAPDTSGRAMVVGFMPNPRTSVASHASFSSSYPSTFSASFSHYHRSGYSSSLSGSNDHDYSRNDPVFSAPPAVIVTPPVVIPHCPPELRGSGHRGDYARSLPGENSRWHRDAPSSDNSSRSYSDNYSPPPPSSSNSYSPPPAPAPTPAPALDYTPSSSSSVADHPTSG